MTNKKRIPEYKKLRENMNVSMTISQKEEIEKRAEAKEQGISEYVRNILFP